MTSHYCHLRQWLPTATEKVQWQSPWKYLGWQISESQIRPQKLILHMDTRMLNDAQILLGDLQWLRPIIGFTNEDLEPL